MIIIMLLLILVGSASTAIFLASTGASWAAIALGYVAGGWSGLLGGGMIFFLLQKVMPWRIDQPTKSQSSAQV